MPPSATPHPLGRLLRELFHSRNWEKRLEQHALFLSWEETVGKEIAAQAQPDCIRGDVLWLRVSDSIWMQQLQFQKLVLLEAVNRQLGEKKIKGIRFRLGQSALAAPASPAEEQPREQPVSQQERRQFEKIAGPIKDGELKEILQRFWLKSCRRRKA